MLFCLPQLLSFSVKKASIPGAILPSILMSVSGIVFYFKTVFGKVEWGKIQL
jgi:hypothetical protein